MSLLFRVVFTQECTSTHHKLALDALRHIRSDDATRWMNVFLRHFDAYLQGAKAPDTRFKDFRNHVLHVGDNEWGGALDSVRQWYDRIVVELRARRWRSAVYAAGVLSHYYTDPFQPLHTGQTEEEGRIHRALEWSVARSYEELQNILEEDFGGYPDVDVPTREDWLEEMVRAGARKSHAHYDTLLDHYNLQAGRRNPRLGLDQELKDCLAQLIGSAAVGFSRVLEQAFEEAGVEPPRLGVTLMGYLATLSVPIAWVLRKWNDRGQRAEVARVYREVKRTGRALRSLPADEREVRRLHAEEVLQVALEELQERALRDTGTRHGEGAEPRLRSRKAVTKIVRPLSRIEGTRAAAQADAGIPKRVRFYLEPESDVVEAPSIGSKTAKRLSRIGVHTVADLLELDPEEAAEQLAAGHIDAQLVADWQAQARLVCRTPHLRGNDAQVLVACEIREPEDLLDMDPDELLPLVESFMDSQEGQRVLRDGKRPDLAEVRRWVQCAEQARPLRAA
jgi:predicted flap endonuclease-1-like 5' DNA nuclease